MSLYLQTVRQKIIRLRQPTVCNLQKSNPRRMKLGSPETLWTVARKPNLSTNFRHLEVYTHLETSQGQKSKKSEIQRVSAESEKNINTWARRVVSGERAQHRVSHSTEGKCCRWWGDQSQVCSVREDQEEQDLRKTWSGGTGSMAHINLNLKGYINTDQNLEGLGQMVTQLQSTF